MSQLIRGFLVSAFLTTLLTGTAAAQERGSINGRLTAAESGAPVRSALVEALDASGRSVASTLTNQDGRYLLQGIMPGTYTVSASAVGFGTQEVQSVQVTAGAAATVNASLQPVAVELNPLVISGSRRAEKALESPSRVEVVSEAEIRSRPALSPVDHLRSVPAVDIITSGLQSTNVVVRGFNNIFSGSLHTLTDNRIAGIPSLRVNLMHFVPQTNEDFERMEVVLGPASALYGPNTANGVLHIITKSPLDDPGSAFSIAGGERSVLHFVGRSAHRLSDVFGIKVSGQYFQGEEWEYRDPVEQETAALIVTDFDAWALTQPLDQDGQPLTPAELQQRASRIAARDFDLRRWSLDTRADWRPTDDFSSSFTAGWTSAAQGIELTGIGAGQVEDWLYAYYQARFNYKRWFAQTYLNTSDAGGTFLLRTGEPIVDKSKVLVSQIQHGSSVGNRVELTYGGDYIRTMPETEGTINGSREDDDNFDQYGVYLQGTAALTPQLDLVLAGRGDWHSELDDPVFSPRAGIVYKPTPEHNVRVTYNRAFSTPSSLNLFLDIDGGPAGPLGPLGFRVRAQGPGGDGIRLVGEDGLPLGMRSPFSGAPAQLQTVSRENLFDFQLNALSAQLPQLAPLFAQMRDPLKAGIGSIAIVTLNPSTQEIAPLAPGSVANVRGIEPSLSSTFEVGYRGIVGRKVLLAADVWRSEETDFTSPLVVRTPLLMLNPLALGAYLQENAAPTIVQALMQQGVPQDVAVAQAGEIINNWVRIPAGVASSEDVAARGADLLATYVNFGELDLWGFDIGATALLTDVWTLGVTYSHVSDHSFCLVDPPAGNDCPTSQLVALNAAKDKGTATLGYRSIGSGFHGEARVRHTGEFPVNSADFVGLECIGGGGEECVESFTLFDLNLGYRLPTMAGASIELGITNLFDEDYRSFVGVPRVGRLALLRLRYEL